MRLKLGLDSILGFPLATIMTHGKKYIINVTECSYAKVNALPVGLVKFSAEMGMEIRWLSTSLTGSINVVMLGWLPWLNTTKELVLGVEAATTTMSEALFNMEKFSVKVTIRGVPLIMRRNRAVDCARQWSNLL